MITTKNRARPRRNSSFLSRFLSVAALTASVAVHAQTVNVVADTGTADAGVESRPIANVAANDTVDGVPATLGANGNAVVMETSPWPPGFALGTTTGAVVTAAPVRAGIYLLPYTLCDMSSPPNCGSATDTVTVVTPSIVATPDTGTADAGVTSKPIVNVTSNDSIDGAPVVLGTSGGNATIAEASAWPVGITLNTATGAVLTSAAAQPAVYSIPYRLCDTNSPPVCATATDTVTVVTAVVLAVPESGNAIAGVASKPIANVTANDSIDGAAVTLGVSGNGTVSRVAPWPAGISLNTATGAVVTSSTVPVGIYSVSYRLCDTNSPPLCETAADTVSVTLREVQVSKANLGDIEFDWGRDGVFCADCNFGQGNARFNWTDTLGNLWVGHVDPTTGAFTPAAGKNELVDTSAFYYSILGNGPEWAFSTQNGAVSSQLVYSRYAPGTSAVAANSGAAFATPISGGWAVTFFPGAEPVPLGGTTPAFEPLASQCNADPVASAYFYESGAPLSVYWEPVSTAPGTMPILTPFSSNVSQIPGSKRAASWVPCTHQMVFVGDAPPDGSGNVYEQVFLYDTDTQAVVQLTTDAAHHTEAFMWQAPELSDAYVFYTITNSQEIDVYEQTGVGTDGSPIFQLINAITSPDPAEPYISNTEPFVHCTPACQSYLFMGLTSQAPGAPSTTTPNGVAVTNIDPAQPMFKVLVPQQATPTIQRLDLEYYITAKGAYLYYDRNTITSTTTQFQIGGRYFIDMQLGTPSGPCVGSSAEGGLLPGC